MLSSGKNVIIQVNTYPHPRQFTFVLMINGRHPIPEDGILSTTWNMGDGTILDDFDLQIDYTYPSSGAYAVAVDVIFEGLGKEEQSKNASSKDLRDPASATASAYTTVAAG